MRVNGGRFMDKQINKEDFIIDTSKRVDLFEEGLPDYGQAVKQSNANFFYEISEKQMSETGKKQQKTNVNGDNHADESDFFDEKLVITWKNIEDNIPLKYDEELFDGNLLDNVMDEADVLDFKDMSEEITSHSKIKEKYDAFKKNLLQPFYDKIRDAIAECKEMMETFAERIMLVSEKINEAINWAPDQIDRLQAELEYHQTVYTDYDQKVQEMEHTRDHYLTNPPEELQEKFVLLDQGAATETILYDLKRENPKDILESTDKCETTMCMLFTLKKYATEFKNLEMDDTGNNEWMYLFPVIAMECDKVQQSYSDVKESALQKIYEKDRAHEGEDLRDTEHVREIFASGDMAKIVRLTAEFEEYKTTFTNKKYQELKDIITPCLQQILNSNKERQEFWLEMTKQSVERRIEIDSRAKQLMERLPQEIPAEKRLEAAYAIAGLSRSNQALAGLVQLESNFLFNYAAKLSKSTKAQNLEEREEGGNGFFGDGGFDELARALHDGELDRKEIIEKIGDAGDYTDYMEEEDFVKNVIYGRLSPSQLNQLQDFSKYNDMSVDDIQESYARSDYQLETNFGVRKFVSKNVTKRRDEIMPYTAVEIGKLYDARVRSVKEAGIDFLAIYERVKTIENVQQAFEARKLGPFMIKKVLRDISNDGVTAEMKTKEAIALYRILRGVMQEFDERKIAGTAAGTRLNKFSKYLADYCTLQEEYGFIYQKHVNDPELAAYRAARKAKKKNEE